MALILTFVNQSSLAEISDYRVEVLVGNGSTQGSHLITRGRVMGHRRRDGWRALVQQFLDKSAAEEEVDGQ